MDVDVSRGEGFRSYYIQKIEELQLIVADKSQNLRRLQAQRNELNAKGKHNNIDSSHPLKTH
jgi:26S proteasome regulatory subunit T6